MCSSDLIEYDAEPVAIFNLGNTEEVTILDLAHRVKEACGVVGEINIRMIPYANFGGNYEDVRPRIPDITRAREVLGFNPTVNLREGLQPTVAWQRQAMGLLV